MNEAKRPRGRPRKHDETVLVDRAIEVFWRLGYEATSLGDLTEAMEMSRPSFYLAFDSKEALFLRALDRYAATVGTAPVAAMDGAADARAAVTAFLRAALESNTRDGAPTGCLFACAASTSAGVVPGVRERIAAVMDGAREALAARLESERRAVLAVDLMNAQALRARAGETRAQLMAGLPARVDAVLAT